MAMFEIRIHGRGGQGAKTAAEFIVEAAIKNNKCIQSFPEYGPERVGAPMCVFVRLSDDTIKTYAPITAPDLAMVMDPTLLAVADVTEGMAADGILIVNTSDSAESIRVKTKFPGKIYTLDATQISIECTGQNLPNMPMLGAFIKIIPGISLEIVCELIKDKFLKKIGAEKTQCTINAIKTAYGRVT